jgi:ribosomal protein S18 acetylase RimI-like enzyme
MTGGLTFRRFREEDQDAVWSVFVGELDGEVVAHAALLQEPEGRAKVRRVAVHPAVQRRGIGQALMAEVEVHARLLGIVVLYLDASQIAAQALYRRCGYKETGCVVLGGVDCILYEKNLEPPSPVIGTRADDRGDVP